MAASLAANRGHKDLGFPNARLLALIPFFVTRDDIAVACNGRSQASRQRPQLSLAVILGASRVLASRRQRFTVFEGAEEVQWMAAKPEDSRGRLSE